MAATKPPLAWERNNWTGEDVARLSSNERIVRMPPLAGKADMYQAEFWGDFSLHYPKHGPWRKTLQAALSDLQKLVRKEETP